MVQLHGFSPYHINRGHYWKIDSGEGMTTKTLRLYLRSKGYCCTTASQRSRLLALYSRCQRGLLSYDRLSVRELESFIVRRGLSISPDQKCTTNVLKAQLEEADEAPFDRFLELPAEIHCQIFEHYFDSYDGSSFERSPIGPQPPITRVSRQLRAEALPLFYSRSCFFLDCSADPRGIFDESSNDFLQNTQSRYFALIRCIKLLVVKDAFWKISIRIDFDAHGCSLKVLDPEGNKGRSYDLKTPTRQHLDELLMEKHHALIRGIALHDGKDKLEKVLLLKERLWQTLRPILDI